MPVDDSRMAALQSGEVNWVDAIPLQKVPDDQRRRRVQLLHRRDGRPARLLGDEHDQAAVRQRQAAPGVAWATDRKRSCNSPTPASARSRNEEVATGNAWHTGSTDLRHRPRHREGDGRSWPSPATTPATPIKYLGLPQYPELLRTGEILKDNLCQDRLDLEIEQQEVTVWAPEPLRQELRDHLRLLPAACSTPTTSTTRSSALDLAKQLRRLQQSADGPAWPWPDDPSRTSRRARRSTSRPATSSTRRSR